MAWLVHVAALSMAPISIVQAVLAGGAVTLAVMAQRVFGDPVERRQWLALLLGGAGLALLVLTVPHFSGSHSGFAVGGILGFEGGLALLAAGLALGHRSERLADHSSVLLAAIAGILFALAGIAIKGLTGVGGHLGRRSRALGPADRPRRRRRPVRGGRRAPARRRDRDDRADGPGRQRGADRRRRPRLRRPALDHPLGLTLQATAFAMVCGSALLIPSRRPRARAAAAAA